MSQSRNRSDVICDMQQKVVKKAKNITLLRCMNRKSSVHGQEVTDAICQACPFKVKRHERPCRNKPSAPTPPTPRQQEEHEEMLELVMDSPLGIPEDINEEVPGFPGLKLQLWTYAEAVKKWNQAGRPVRSEEEVKAILEDHCKPCSWYDNGRCRGCGCKVSVSTVAVLNKLKMATESCPKGLW